MNIINSLTSFTLTDKNKYAWQFFAILIGVAAGALLYYFIQYQNIILFIISLWVLFDAFVVKRHQLGATEKDSRGIFILFAVIGMLGITYALLMSIQVIPIRLSQNLITAIAFTPPVITNQVLNMFLAKLHSS